MFGSRRREIRFSSKGWREVTATCRFDAEGRGVDFIYVVLMIFLFFAMYLFVLASDRL